MFQRARRQLASDTQAHASAATIAADQAALQRAQRSMQRLANAHTSAPASEGSEGTAKPGDIQAAINAKASAATNAEQAAARQKHYL